MNVVRTIGVVTGTLAALLLAGSSAWAASTSTNFGVTATVLNACAVVAAPLAFGNYDPTSGTDATGSTTLTVTCTTGVAFTLGLNQGTYGGSVTARTMKRTTSADTLAYGLYRDASRTQNWGTTAGTDTMGATAGALPTSFTAYGAIAAGQNVPAGAYSDSVQVTVNY